MPLIKCPECKHEMSTRADYCPHCGRRRMRARNDGFAIFIIIALVIACAVFVFLHATGHRDIIPKLMDSLSNAAATTTAQSRQPADGAAAKKQEWIDRSLDLIRRQMSDSKNVLFRNVYYNANTTDGTKIRVICGEISSVDSNSRYQRFISSYDTGMTSLELKEPRFPSLWSGLCVAQ
jgi:hypothetical protein